MYQRSVIQLVFLLFLAGCRGGDIVASESPSDSEVRRILEKSFLDKYFVKILLGKQIVPPYIANPGGYPEISPEEFKEVNGWAQAGLISIQTEDLRLYNWGLVQKAITMTPTEKGREFQKDSKIHEPLDPKFLYARFATQTVSDIVENREVKKDVELYRVVKGTIKVQFNEVGAKVYSIAGKAMIPQMNFIILLKYNSFQKEWNMVSWDYFLMDERGFKTNNVERYLSTR